MIEVIFTIDYEIYGTGKGALKGLVYEPTQKLVNLFNELGAKLVVFTEAAEFEKICGNAADPYIGKVEEQIHQLYHQGHEIALHLHPQWYRAVYKDGEWEMDYNDYNLCNMEEDRIGQLVNQSIGYLRGVLKDSSYIPFSFRAGGWLFQPTAKAARVMAAYGIKIDSSLYKGGRQCNYKLDYRPSKKNGYWWYFKDEVNAPDNNGLLLEVPVYTRMVPFWKMATLKRIGIQKQNDLCRKDSVADRIYRLMDLASFLYPLKFDFCRMTLNELIDVVNCLIQEDEKTPSLFKPIVAIGHSKDLVDIKTIGFFMRYLRRNGIKISTLREIYPKCKL